MNRCIIGDCREVLRSMVADGVRANMCVTSPPYWGLRDYGVAGQLGLEATPQEYIANMVEVFRLVRELLADDGTLWLNLGDSYHNGDKGGYAKDRVKVEDSMQRSNLGANFIGAPNRQPQEGLKPKDLCGVPWMAAFALRADGWYLRQDIIWSKPNPMPESVRDRCTKAHEYLFLLAKSERYYYDAAAIAEQSVADHPPGSTTRNKRSVWTVATQPYSEAHFATFPPALIEPCILAGSRPGDVVLDPFFGSGTTGEVCERLGRKWIGIELSSEYGKLAERRTAQQGLALA